jgi:hypothetical protein
MALPSFGRTGDVEGLEPDTLSPTSTKLTGIQAVEKLGIVLGDSRAKDMFVFGYG